VDIFSLGLLVVEVFGGFETIMERADAFKGLRGTVPKLPAGYPIEKTDVLHEVLLSMLDSNPESRPSARKLLESPLFDPESSEALLVLKNEIKEKDQQLQEQAELIARLQAQLGLTGPVECKPIAPAEEAEAAKLPLDESHRCTVCDCGD
jgi:hypothetical protein